METVTATIHHLVKGHSSRLSPALVLMWPLGCLSCWDAAKAARDGSCWRDDTKLCSSCCRQGKQQRMVRGWGGKALPWPCLHFSVPDTGAESYWFISFCIKFRCCSWSLLLCSLRSTLPCTLLPGRELLNVCVPHFFTLWLFYLFFFFPVLLMPQYVICQMRFTGTWLCLTGRACPKASAHTLHWCTCLLPNVTGKPTQCYPFYDHYIKIKRWTVNQFTVLRTGFQGKE